MSWLETLKNLDTENTRDSEAATDPTSSAAAISESLTQQGDKSAKRGDQTSPNTSLDHLEFTFL